MVHVLILGGGFGGVACAVALRERLPPIHEITVVDRHDTFRMGLTKLMILDGRRQPGESARSLRLLERKGIRFIQGNVDALDVGGRRAIVSGREVGYDHVVVASGAVADAAAVPGFAESPDAYNLYAHEGVAGLHAALAERDRGRVVVAIHSAPFKCPPAPYEAALIADSWLRARGVRDGFEIMIVTPEPHPLPVAGPECGGTLTGFLDDADVRYRPKSPWSRIDVNGRALVLDSGETVPFDILAVVPPHRPPSFISGSGLAGPAGWIPIHAGTGVPLEVPRVHAIGDVTTASTPSGKPLPKAGVFAEAEGLVVAENLAARILGHEETARLDGKGGCFLEVGGGQGVFVEGDFFATPSPRITIRGPSKEHYEAKLDFEGERLRRWFT